MSEALLSGDETLQQAAALAFAFIRFESAAAHPSLAAPAPGRPRIGVDAYLFSPSWRPVRNEDVVQFLSGLPSPALLSATTTRGVVAMTLIDELAGERAQWGRKSISNQRDGLDEVSARIGLEPRSKLLLEFDDETHLVSLDVLRKWAQRFAGPVMWSISQLDADPRAAARINLIRSDGHESLGGTCSITADA